MPGFKYQGTQYQMLGEDDLLFAEGRAVERVTGHTLSQFSDPEVGGSLTSMQALLWVSMKRKNPELKFSDLDDMAIGDFEWDEDEPTDSAMGEAPDPTDADEAPSPTSV